MSISLPKIRLSSSLSWSPCWLLDVVADHQSQCVIRSLLPASRKLTQTQDILLQPPSQALKFCKISISRCVVVVSIVTPFTRVHWCDWERSESPGRASLALPGLQKAWFGDSECQSWPRGFGVGFWARWYCGLSACRWTTNILRRTYACVGLHWAVTVAGKGFLGAPK